MGNWRLYSVTGFPGADALLSQLGKHTASKGCLYITKLTDVDQKVLEAMIARALAAKRARHPS